MRRIAVILAVTVLVVIVAAVSFQRAGRTVYPIESLWSKMSYDNLVVVQSAVESGAEVNEETLRILAAAERIESFAVAHSTGTFPAPLGDKSLVLDGDLCVFPANDRLIATTRASPKGTFIVLTREHEIVWIRPRSEETRKYLD